MNKTVNIEGMHCEHCKNRVTRALLGLGIESVEVDLQKKKAKLSGDKDVADAAIKKAVEDIGFAVISIA